MDFLKKIGSLFSSSGGPEPLVYWTYVKCSRCGEKIRSRVDLRNDVSIEYDDGPTTYFTRKTLIGDRGCYQPVEVELTFDSRRQLINQEIKGGVFIDEEEFEQDEENGEEE